MFETDKAMFDYHQMLATSAVADNWDFIEENDRAIIPLLNAINKHPNINTRWSCSGHYRETKEGPDKDGYVAMSVRGTAAYEMLDFVAVAMHHEPLKLGQRPFRMVGLDFSELQSDIQDLFKLGSRPSLGWRSVCLRFKGVGGLPVEKRELFYSEVAALFESFLVKWGHA